VASSTSFEQNYLASNLVKPSAGKGQLAGLVYSLRRQMQDGNSATVAHQVVDNARALEVVDRAARVSALAAVRTDYLAIDSA
jgi:hypothetical protein